MKNQIKKSNQEYRRGEARNANQFLAELSRPHRKASSAQGKSKKKIGR